MWQLSHLQHGNIDTNQREFFARASLFCKATQVETLELQILNQCVDQHLKIFQ